MFKKNGWMIKLMTGGVLAALIAGALALAAPAQAVFAAGLEQTTPPPVQETRQAPNPERLEKAFARLQDLIGKQAERIGKTDELVSRVQGRIDELKAKGKDTGALETALSEFKAQVAEAHSQHDQAAAVLEKHAGFDDAGKVVDAAQARETVKEAGSLMKNARQSLRPAVRELLQALRDYIRDNRLKP